MGIVLRSDINVGIGTYEEFDDSWKEHVEKKVMGI